MLNPHPALRPDLSINDQRSLERAHRQLLVQGLLASLLPTEDLRNSPFRVLVTDIIADLILGRVIDDRICKGWFLHETVSKVVATITLRTQPKVTGAEMQADARGRLEKFGLLSAKVEDSHDNSPRGRQSSLSAWFWMILQWIYLAFSSLRLITAGLMHARRLPPRSCAAASPTSPTKTPISPGSPSPHGNDSSSHVVLDYRLFPAISTLLNLSRRMPWLVGFFCFVQHVLTSRAGRVGPPDSLIDK
jgi:PXA domain